MNFSMETRNLIRVLPHIYVKVIKFYLPNFHISLWPQSLVHETAVARRESNLAQELFFFQTGHHESDVLFFCIRQKSFRVSV